MTLTKLKDLAKKLQEHKFTFGIKLAFIVTVIVLASILAITFLTRFMVSAEFIRTAGEANFAFNSRAAAGVEERLYNIRSEALTLLDISENLKDSPPRVRQIRNIFFERNPGIAGIIVPGREEIINRLFLANHELPLDAFDLWLYREGEAIERAGAGEPILRNVSPDLGINLLALFYPWQNAGTEEAAVVFFSPQSISEITGSGPSTTMVINGEGDILVHPDFNRALQGANISYSALFDALWKSANENVSLNFSEGGIRYVGAGHQVSIASAAVFSIREFSVINEQINAVTRRNILLAVTMLFLTILVTWYFSKTITRPVNKLIEAASKLESGDFDLQLESESHDEIGLLTNRFGTMVQGLKHWVDVTNLIGRYNSLEITDKAMAGKVNMEGEYLSAVVLSVNFVSFYETFEKQDATESLKTLNFFIERITEHIHGTGGVVDKLLGSRLIALWGVPFASTDLSAEVLSAIRAMLSMRTELWELNTERESQGKHLLRMRCGIHAGKLLAGRLENGSFHEYTVSGETVDLAMKYGGINRLAKTDIMISNEVHAIAGTKILAEEFVPPKGQKIDFKVFSLINLTPTHEHEKQRWPFTLDDVKKSLQSGRNVPKATSNKDDE